jgi:hypothetical protein
MQKAALKTNKLRDYIIMQIIWYYIGFIRKERNTMRLW